ncbi:hypothetical protein D9619_001500 [Psilocybe cf. subviscida]|uniref:Ankyrin n=1 Tax=Psilocybe cf. subviscida TaxID=2480587 RepID=A0A8H5F345_9AGAR|nr:hypothetical protein D9619_001500 [Psilocybe cf. subviscida]
MPVPMRTNLHKAEAKYNVTTEFPSLGLHSAAATGNVGLVEYALNNGQPVNSVLDGVLPLHAACAGGNVQVVKVLIDHGADVNAARLPRKYSIDKGRDSSTPIVGTSGSTPLHFAAANGNTDVVSLLLLHGAHADRADKHGVTPEMLATQNGWVESASLLREWIANKDRDLRDRAPGPSNGFDPRMTSTASPRRRLHVKQSIDTALNMLKAPETLPSKHARSLHTSTPPASPHRPLDDSGFFTTDTDIPVPQNPGGRRPSLPHIMHPPSNDMYPPPRKVSLTRHSSDHRRPSSAENGAEQESERENMYPVYGRGGQGRRLGSKYSLMNIFRKGQECADSSDATGPLNSSASTPNRSAQVSNADLGAPGSLPENRSPFLHRNNDTSPRGRIPSPPTHPQMTSSPPSFTASIRSPSRATAPLPADMHLAFAREQQRMKSTSSQDERDRAQAASPLRKHIPLLSGHNRNRSASASSMLAPDTSAVEDEDATGTPDSESGKPSPNFRPGILRGHNRAPSAGQASSPLIPRTLRFDSATSNSSSERRVRESPRTVPAPLRSYSSTGSLTKSNRHANHHPIQEAASDTASVKDDDDEADYGKPIDDEVGPSNVPSVLLQRQRGHSFASSSESSLSPILTNDHAGEPSALTSEFPFSINHNPPTDGVDGVDIDEQEQPTSVHLTVPVLSDTRHRGDSLSSTSTTDSHGSNLLMRSTDTSGSDTSVTVSSPGMAHLSTSAPDASKAPEQIRPRGLSFDVDKNSNVLFSSNPIGINERRSRGPLDINISAISSHAQAEALVERARREVLEVAGSADLSPPGSSLGRTPLSARLAAYGESLAIEKKLREEMEARKQQDSISNLSPSARVSSSASASQSQFVPSDPRTSSQGHGGTTRQSSLDNNGVAPQSKKRSKDPRRPSTADGVVPNKQEMFAQNRTYSHQSSRSISTADYNGAPVGGDNQRIYPDPPQERSNRSREQSLPRSFEPLHPVYGIPSSYHHHTPVLPSDESLARIHSSDGADTETDSVTVHRPNVASSSARGKREQQVRTAKLTKMGFPVEAAAARPAPVSSSPPAGAKRFGITRIMQTFKGKV